MAKRVVTNVSKTWAPTANNVAVTQWIAIKGGSATQIIDCLEFLISGMASSSIPMSIQTAYSSTLGGTPTTPPALPDSDGPMVVNATALASPAVAYTAATTGPTPNSASTLPRLNLGLNVFGGIIRWNAAPTQQWTSVGSAINGGETVLFADSSAGQSGTGALNAHIIYEPY
jgi:hypothetical protein